MRAQVIRLLVVVLLGVSLSVQASISLPLEDGSTVELYDKSYALLIGVSDYEHWPDLPGVEEDIELVGESLKKHGFKVISLLNPTRSSFDDTMRNFIGDYGQDPENRLIIYYAGHGYTLTTNRGRELGYIVPSDTPLPKDGTGGFKKKAISMLEIEIFAKQMESKHAMFTFDSCFSGSLFEITRAVPDTISLKTSEPVRQFITAGSAEQTVPDKSVFRSQFVAGLEGEADVNKDGFITGTELAQYIEESVTNYTRRAQTPQYGKIRDPYLDKGDFVFINPRMEITINVRGEKKASSDSSVDPLAVELSYWDSIKDTKSVEIYQSYLAKYPEGQFADLANLLIEESKNAAQVAETQKQARAAEEIRYTELRVTREKDFARQQQLLEQQRLQNEKSMALIKAEQQAALQIQESTSRQQVTMVSPTIAATAISKKFAVVVRGETKFASNLNETQHTRVLGEIYKTNIKNLLPAGSKVTVISESSNNYKLAYEGDESIETKRICREQSVDAVVIGFVEVISETSWPDYSISYFNCESGRKITNSYNLDKNGNDNYAFERAVKTGLKTFWRNYVLLDLQ